MRLCVCVCVCTAELGQSLLQLHGSREANNSPSSSSRQLCSIFFFFFPGRTTRRLIRTTYNTTQVISWRGGLNTIKSTLLVGGSEYPEDRITFMIIRVNH